MLNRNIKYLVSVVILVLLTSCGGGGSEVTTNNKPHQSSPINQTNNNPNQITAINKSLIMPLNPGHYIQTEESISNDVLDTLVQNPNIKGVSVVYNWVDLEIQKNVYDFSSIENDLALLRPLNKQLIIMIRDKSFKKDLFIPVPSYMLTSEYQGGFSGTDSHMAKRWVHSVSQRYRALITALGSKFNSDPNFEAIKTSETATGNTSGHPDYNAENYFNELTLTINTLAKAFPDKVKVFYLNWLPGMTNKLSDLALHAANQGVGIGGPDVHPDTLIPSYGLFSPLSGNVPLMTDVQYSNYEHVSPAGDSDQLLSFATTVLNVDYICWRLRKAYIHNITETINHNPTF